MIHLFYHAIAIYTRDDLAGTEPVFDGNMLALELDEGAATYRMQKKNNHQLMVVLLVTRTGIEPMLPP